MAGDFPQAIWVECEDNELGQSHQHKNHLVTFPYLVIFDELFPSRTCNKDTVIVDGVPLQSQFCRPYELSTCSRLEEGDILSEFVTVLLDEFGRNPLRK